MKTLQVSDMFMRHALTEWQAAQKNAAFVLGDQDSDAMLVFENNSFVLRVQGHDVDRWDAPVRMHALLADVLWLMARRAEESVREIKLSADYVLLPHAFSLRLGDLVAGLTGREVALLQFLAQAGECSKERLLSDVWHYHPDSDTHTVETHLWRLRQKLLNAGMTAPLVVTTAKGYRLA